MIFHEQSHINRIRDALWQRRGGASVMVGAGFSINAEKGRPDADAPPTWYHVTNGLSDELYPQDANRSRPNSDGAVSPAESFTNLTQEYVTARGRSDLHRFLQNLVRDNDFKPADIHKRLLRLPWCDVFTTNWDTLLERTLSAVTERKYSVVRNKDEIPLAARPRIIKLHGSFPAHFPLICTEEDYRTYPRDFAPFVNTVQQSMMETVFCLIGFSGNDPNFLHWSGWVRDNMGTSAPNIYLAGWLDLSPHRRRVLEARNVIPIDLAHHPKANEWPEHMHHHYATDWILQTLERGRPYDATDWPSSQTWQFSPIPEYLQPIVEVVANKPKKEPWHASEVESEDLPKRVREIIDIWTHNRNLYPGWLVVPASVRQDISSNTNKWELHILRALPHFPPAQRLKSIRELVWRREILAEPISLQLESAAEEILNAIDCQTRTIDSVAATGIKWRDVREAWRTVALALVTVARHKFDNEVFQQRIDALQDFRNDDPNVAQRIHHEQCLWAIYSMDFEKLAGLLNDWSSEHCDPFWMVRKAAILVETNRLDDAIDLFKRALLTIREIPHDSRSVAGPSREGWALWLAWTLEWTGFTRDTAKGSPHPSPFFRRWRELSSMKCDALSEKHAYAGALRPETERETGPPFDLEIRTLPGHRFSNAKHNRWVAARRAIRLSEVTGLPTPGLDILKLAATELSATEPEMAVRLILRTLNYDGDPSLKRILSRPKVAMMPVDLANTLTHLCASVLEHALPRISVAGAVKRPVFWLERMRVAMEALSRLVVRLESDRVEETFNEALKYYGNDDIARDIWLGDPVRNLLARSWQALPEDRRTARILDLLSAPIVGMDNFAAPDSHYPDPGVLLHDDLVPPIRNGDNEDRWQEIVRFLVRGLRTGGEARKRASLRIAPLVSWERLTVTESSQVAQALWSEKYTDPNDLPGETLLFDWEILLLPEPELGLAERRFRSKWLVAGSEPQENGSRLDDILWQVGISISCLRKHGRSLDLSEDERSYLIEIVKQWSDSPIPSHFFPLMERQLREPIHRALVGLCSVISETKIPEQIGEKLYTKVQALNESEIPSFGVTVGLVEALPARFDGIALSLRMGLVSDNVDLAENATSALHYWLTVSSNKNSRIRQPPDDLVREIGVIIATRRKASLGQALQTAKWIFDEGSQPQRDAVCQLALQGLGYLFEELKYDRNHEQEDNTVPLLRWWSVQLALSMAKCGFEKAPAVVCWLKIVEKDPLPEVRNAKGPTFARQRETAARIKDEPDNRID